MTDDMYAIDYKFERETMQKMSTYMQINSKNNTIKISSVSSRPISPLLGSLRLKKIEKMERKTKMESK
jgi:hypothetical protein